MHNLKQKWTGYITELLKDSFISRLKDVSNDGVNEEIELKYVDISKKDNKYIQLGSCFTFEIGIKNKKEYQKIKFIKPRKISKQDIVKAELWAKEMMEGINWM